MESVSTVLCIHQFNISPVPSQVNVAVVKGGTVTDTGGTVMTKRNLMIQFITHTFYQLHLLIGRLKIIKPTAILPA